MNKDDLKEVFLKAAEKEFEYVPKTDDEIDYTFSDSFEKKMDDLIVSTKKKWWQKINISYKKVACLVIVVLGIIYSSSFVTAENPKINDFTVMVEEGFNVYRFPDSGSLEKIEYEYSFSELPEGFHELEEEGYRDKHSVSHVYLHEHGGRLILRQRLSGNGYSSIDNEQGVISEVIINNHRTILYVSEKNQTIFAKWFQDGYVLEVRSVRREFSVNEFLSWVERVQ